MKKLIAFLSLLFCLTVHSQDVVAVTPVYNTIAMSYATMTVYQQIVLSATQKAGGTFSFSVKAMDGGGRGPPNFPQDVANISMQFYNSSGTLIGTAASNNSTVFNTFNTYTVSTANCGGGGCANVYFMRINMTGNDGGYWAGNMGTNFKEPTLTFDGGPNLIYNPEFGVNGTYTSTSAPHGWWNSTNAWGGNTRPQLLNNNGTVNAGNVGYLAQGGTLSGTVGGYPAASTYPSYMTVGSNPGTMTYGTSAAITTQQQTRVTAFQNRTITNNTIYIDQVGDNNNIQITQTGNNSSISGIDQQAASIQGNSNSITIRQGDTADTNKNEINLRTQGNSNTLNINQGVTTTGASVNSTNGMYQSVDVIGSYNALTTQQTNTGGIGGHYMETTINGNSNNVIAKQTDNANKTMFTTVTGDNNTVNATQSGTGQHYLETVLMGNGNSVTATQTGNTQNRASISITNAGGPGSVDLQQSGGANYNITTTCVTAGGCGTVTVRQ